MMHLQFYFVLPFVLSFVQNAPIKTEDSKRYLMNYGYLSTMKCKDLEYKTALEKFQRTYSLPVSGKLDVKTTKQMQKPRCGKSDNLTNIFSKNPWEKSVLSYKFKSFPRNGLSRSTAIKEISKAFDLWAQYIPVKFEFKEEGQVDIDVNFPPASSGDGIGNTLAYAYYPKVGDIYFDAEEWTAGSYKGTNLFNTAAHEIGHSLGLQHSNSANALMNPYILPYNPSLDLFEDDIWRIQNLYGKKGAPKTPSTQLDLCKIDQIDTVFFSPEDQSLYVIKNNLSWKLKDRKIQLGFPKEISELWHGISDNVDAAYHYKNNIYFAENRSILRYDGQKHDYRKLVKSLNAAEMYRNKLYLFSGSEMWSFDMTNGKQVLEPEFPKQIASVWKGAPSTIDALYYDRKEYFYLFKDAKVYKFNLNKQLMKTISLERWLSC